MAQRFRNVVEGGSTLSASFSSTSSSSATVGATSSYHLPASSSSTASSTQYTLPQNDSLFSWKTVEDACRRDGLGTFVSNTVTLNLENETNSDRAQGSYFESLKPVYTRAPPPTGEIATHSMKLSEENRESANSAQAEPRLLPFLSCAAPSMSVHDVVELAAVNDFSFLNPVDPILYSQYESESFPKYNEVIIEKEKTMASSRREKEISVENSDGDGDDDGDVIMQEGTIRVKSAGEESNEFVKVQGLVGSAGMNPLLRERVCKVLIPLSESDNREGETGSSSPREGGDDEDIASILHNVLSSAFLSQDETKLSLCISKLAPVVQRETGIENLEKLGRVEDWQWNSLLLLEPIINMFQHQVYFFLALLLPSSVGLHLTLLLAALPRFISDLFQSTMKNRDLINIESELTLPHHIMDTICEIASLALRCTCKSQFDVEAILILFAEQCRKVGVPNVIYEELRLCFEIDSINIG